VTLADEFAAVAKAAFLAGALAQTAKIAKQSGKSAVIATADTTVKVARKTKRVASAYSKRYGRAFKKVASRFKKKNGSWKANGFKNAQAAAHKLARGKK